MPVSFNNVEALVLLLTLPAGLYFLAACGLTRHRWPLFRALGLLAFLGAGTATVLFHVQPQVLFFLQLHVPWSPEPLKLLRADGLSLLMLTMITCIGWKIIDFSQHYLAGEEGQGRYQGWLGGTLMSVSLLVTANHLLLMAAAWIATSLCLHRLLTFYPDRPRALLAAHKKFLVSRLGDACILAAFLLLGQGFGSLEIDRILALIETSSAPGSHTGLAAILLVFAAALKSAQLPFHGWLLQVMEAPTPVSALLHAGVVNMGGFLLIRLAPVFSAHEPALWLLLLFGGVTAIVASLVILTRISIKLMLAWSTCAQMGFMLVEIALGAYHLALLHLVAHSFYKAHAFLSSGQAVKLTLIRKHTAWSRPTPWHHWLTGLLVSGGVLAGLVMASGKSLDTGSIALAGILCLGLAVWSSESLAAQGWRGVLPALMVSLILAGAYLLLDPLFRSARLPAPVQAPDAFALLLVTAFGLLYLFYAGLRSAPASQFYRQCYPWFYHGFHLDALFTRLTFRIWPPSPARRPFHERPAQVFIHEGVD